MILLTVCLLACRAKPAPPQVMEQTAFYTLSLTRDTIKKNTTFTITKVQIAHTKINYHIDEQQAKNPHFLSIEITDKSNHVIHAFTDHPLYKRFDLYQESGEIESKSISLQQGETVFRVPYFSEYKKIKITETINFTQGKEITIQP
ncbi:MAG: hypothetical protein V4580_11695 [Bacteroidota bacterium]